jgi:Pyridine nucleotide-disulphide oxidoreductase
VDRRGVRCLSRRRDPRESRWLSRPVRSKSALLGEHGVGNEVKAMDDLAERSGVTQGDAPRPASARRPRIVIIGAGFGGLSAAQRLARVAADVIVIDRRNHHLFQRTHCRKTTMRSPNFWSWFDGIAGPQLAHRTEGFRKVFDYLDRFDRPVGIVETGCVRQQDNWAGDGQSTILFDRYAEFHPGSTVFSVDRDPEAAALCGSLVGGQVQIHTGESLAYLKSLADDPPAELEFLDLLYLDSFDVDFDDPPPSAKHHLKELLAIAPLVSFQTLVVVDDSPSSFIGVPDGDNPVQPIRPPRIGGKGRLIAEYADQSGAERLFAEYQCGWLCLGRPPRSTPRRRPRRNSAASAGSSPRRTAAPRRPIG